jgi:hypothetical protein
MKATKITITGEFSEAEVKRILDVLKSIESEHPESDRVYLMDIETDEPIQSTQEALERMMGKVKPGFNRQIARVEFFRGGNG